MRSFVLLASSLVLAVALAACSSDSASTSGPREGLGTGNPLASTAPSPTGETWDDGQPVKGEVLVAWKNLDPTHPAAAVGLVNESSEKGKKLKSGQATSSEIRVLTDAQMGGLLAQLQSLGFYSQATDGLSLDNIPNSPGRKGVVIVTQNGQSKGILLTTNLGRTLIPKVYSESKKVILYAHSQVAGFDVKAGLGESDERTLSVPPPRLRKP